jgi:hypothetical protein
MTYTLLTPSDHDAMVRETREIRHDGRLVANPSAERQRSSGTFTSTLPVTLPTSAPNGTYEVTTTVAMGDWVSRRTMSFTVL